MPAGGGFSGGLHPGVYGGVHNGMHGYGAMPDLVIAMLHQTQQENERLRTEFASMAGELDSMRRAKLELEAEKEAQEEKADFETPESQFGKKQKSSEVDLEEERMGLYEMTPREQFQKLQTMMDEVWSRNLRLRIVEFFTLPTEERSRRFCRRCRTRRT